MDTILQTNMEYDAIFVSIAMTDNTMGKLQHVIMANAATIGDTTIIKADAATMRTRDSVFSRLRTDFLGGRCRKMDP